MSSPAAGGGSGLSIDEEETAETRIRRLISEHPLIIFSRSSCCMCHVMKKLLVTIGVHPTVIELDDHEFASLPRPPSHDTLISSRTLSPAVFIGGTCVGGLESLVALHLSGHLIPKLVEVGVLWGFALASFMGSPLDVYAIANPPCMHIRKRRRVRSGFCRSLPEYNH